MNIITSLQNPQYNTNNHRSLEVYYLKQLLEEISGDNYIVGKKGRTNSDIDCFKSINDNLGDTENIFIQLSPINFYGGVLDKYIVNFIEKIGKLYDKNFFILVNDPRIKPINPARVVSERFGQCSSYIDIWDDILDNATYIFQGKDLNKFWNDDKKYNVLQVDIFTYIFKKNIEFSEFIPTESKKYSVLYYGDNRGSYRTSKIKQFIPDDINSLIIGYKNSGLKSATFKDKVAHNELIDNIDESFVSLIIGDREHEDNIATFRLYETLASSTLAAIDIKYDSNKNLIKNDKLKKALYVVDKLDVIDLKGLYSSDIIEMQQSELKRIFDECNIDNLKNKLNTYV